MSHQRYPSQDVVKEPHPISLKVLRLSRPSLVSQYSVSAPLSTALPPPIVPASLAYSAPSTDTNPGTFLLSPILNLPPSFGSAYVGETFSCTLCANHDGVVAEGGTDEGKTIRDVRIEAEMKTPSAATAVKLALTGGGQDNHGGNGAGGTPAKSGVDLTPGQSLQNVVRFDLKEEGNHVLAVTVSYYEASETSGRTRTFRKLYQFICKSSLIVRTKAGPYAPRKTKAKTKSGGSNEKQQSPKHDVHRRWVLEAQLENCGEDVIQLERVMLDLVPELKYEDCNWETRATSSSSGSGGGGDDDSQGRSHAPPRKPVLHPGEVEQVCFLLEEQVPQGLPEQANGRLVFGVLGIGWRGEMGNRGYLSTGKLGTRAVAVRG